MIVDYNIICNACGKRTTVDGKKTCQNCRDYQNNWARNKRNRAKDIGFCLYCCKRKRKEGHKTACIECLRLTSERNSYAQAKRKSLGLCRFCCRPVGETTRKAKTICDNCLERSNQSKRKSYERFRNSGLCRQCGVESDVNIRTKKGYLYCSGCRRNNRKRDWYLKLKAFKVYGGGVCVCCGESEVLFLQIDHIDGGGCQHRREIKSNKMMKWLKSNNYPEGYQVLCANCNWGRQFNKGVCPHKGRVFEPGDICRSDFLRPESITEETTNRK